MRRFKPKSLRSAPQSAREASQRQATANAATPAEARSKDVVGVVLTVDRGAPTLPIGLPVKVRFDACPSKS